MLKGEAFWCSDTSHHKLFCLGFGEKLPSYYLYSWSQTSRRCQMFWPQSTGHDGGGKMGWARSRWDTPGLAEPLIYQPEDTNSSRNTKFTAKHNSRSQQSHPWRSPWGTLTGIFREEHILNFISHFHFKHFLFLFLISQADSKADEADTQFPHCKQPIMESKSTPGEYLINQYNKHLVLTTIRHHRTIIHFRQTHSSLNICSTHINKQLLTRRIWDFFLSQGFILSISWPVWVCCFGFLLWFFFFLKELAAIFWSRINS